jgi:hypothetical protein
MMMAEKSIGAQLLDATKIGKKRPRESMDDYKKRLLSACDDLTDDVYEKLSTDAQDFLTMAVKIWNTPEGEEFEAEDGEKYPGGIFPDVPGLEAASEQKLSKAKDKDEEPPPTAKAKAKDEESTERRGRGRPAGSTNKPKSNGEARAKSSERKPRQINRDGGVYKIKEQVLRDLEADVPTIQKRVKDTGVDVSTSTVQGIRSDFIHSLRVLQDKNHLKDLELE